MTDNTDLAEHGENATLLEIEDVDISINGDEELGEHPPDGEAQTSFVDDEPHDQEQNVLPNDIDSLDHPHCQACTEVWSDAASDCPIYLNCGHTYCQPCLNALIVSGLSSRSSFPPRCCDASGVDMGSIEPFLTDDVILRYTAVEQEYSERRPVFCAKKNCSKFYPAARLQGVVGKWLFCEDCCMETCLDCRQEKSVHTAATEQGPKVQCPESLIPTEDRELVDGARWKQCPGCKNIVEKSDGCDHMDCGCGTAFCYVCGEEKKVNNSCGCHTVPDEDGWHDRLDEEELRANGEIDTGEDAEHADEEELRANGEMSDEDDDNAEEDDKEDDDEDPAIVEPHEPLSEAS